MKKLITLAALILLAPLSALAAPEIGKPAPAINTTDIDGNIFNTADMKDDIIILEWTNHDCPFVKKFYREGHMQGFQKDYTAKGVKWVRVISSAPGKQGHVSATEAKAIIAEKGANATHTLLDPSGEIGRAYGARTTPHMFVINKGGDLAYMGAIDSINGASSGHIDKPENKKYALNALDNLLAGKPVEIASTKSYGCSVKY